MAKLHLSRADGQVFFFLPLPPLSSSPETGVARKGKEKLFPPSVLAHAHAKALWEGNVCTEVETTPPSPRLPPGREKDGKKEAQLNILTPFALFIHRLWREIDRAALEKKIHLCALPVGAVVEAV